MPSCSACNRRAYDAGSGLQTGKSDIFPTIDNTWAASRLEVDAEQPALLNPWLDTDDPALHLTFDPTTGRVMGLTDRGRETIDILGLNRDGLPEARRDACHNVARALRSAVSDSLAAGPAPEDDMLLQAVIDGSAEFSAICRQALKDKKQQVARILALFDLV